MPKRQSAPSRSLPESPDALLRDVKRMLSREQFGSIDEVNALLQQVAGKQIGVVEPANDRERAEDLVLAARVERTVTKRRQLISQALSLDGDCVPALLLLAEEETSPSEAITLTGNAIAAGERVLAERLADDDAFLWGDPVGRFWLIARAQLAEICWQMGDRRRAIAELRDVLRRNPNDNQGMRYVLLQWLMRAGSVADIDQLLAQFDDSSAAWLFTIALHRYRTEGPSASATKALRAAVAGNRFVVPMLLGAHPMADELPDSYTVGSEDEAALYLESAMTVWIDGVGAIDWAASNARSRSAVKRPRRR